MRKLFIVAIALGALGMFGGTALAASVTVEGNTYQMPPICGGFGGIPCADDQWCDYPDTAVCGAVDQLGICRPRPAACPEVYLPVCGCDGETHGNACKAAAGGTDVAYDGPCLFPE